MGRLSRLGHRPLVGRRAHRVPTALTISDTARPGVAAVVLPFQCAGHVESPVTREVVGKRVAFELDIRELNGALRRVVGNAQLGPRHV